MCDRANTGLVIGKFLPPHAGHQYLIDCARQQVKALTVILFSKGHEPIPGALRLAWLRELYPDLDVRHVTEEHRVDYADAAAWDFWVGAIRAAYPARPDVVFSSEAYGDELARRLGARHVAVDPARAHVPASGTLIREQPMAHWEFIPPPVRPYYVRRVAIVGAESSGKTTLAQALARHFDTVWVPEYARQYLEARGGVCTEADMPVIARGQARAEAGLARQANRLLVLDTNLLTTRLWHEHYFGHCPEEIRRLADERTAHLTLVCAPDVPWVDDGLRDSPHMRGWFHRRFCEELEAQGLAYRVLSGPLEGRMRAAVEAVEESRR